MNLKGKMVAQKLEFHMWIEKYKGERNIELRRTWLRPFFKSLQQIKLSSLPRFNIE